MYDYPTLKTEEDENLKGISLLVNRMSATAASGAYLVEAMPWMLHIPKTYVLLSATYLLRLGLVVLIRKVEV